ncbi:MAG: single-stranded DNA-binding protein [Candidatus Aminicenantes bacterium]|nr:single-stranded DNA-binding protein [Candidatus Aminicenantes bacterium]
MRDINSLNKVIRVGRLGAKPDIRSHAQSGRSSARFNLATNERLYNPSTQTSTDKTEWHRIVVWFPRLVEFSEKYLDKGKQILVEGSIRSREYQDRDGNRRFITEIVADKIVLLGRREESSATRTDTTDLDEVYGRGGTRGGASGSGGGGGGEDDFPSGDDSGGSGGGDDDIPF